MKRQQHHDRRGSSTSKPKLICLVIVLALGLGALVHVGRVPDTPNRIPEAIPTQDSSGAQRNPDKKMLTVTGHMRVQTMETTTPNLIPVPSGDADALHVLAAQSPEALDILLKCPLVADPVFNDDNDVVTLSKERNEDRYQRCYRSPTATFMYFGNHWGRHFNQMTSFVAAVVLSRMLNRTLIVPPLVFENKRVQLHDLYDARRLFDSPLTESGSPFCLLTEDEFLLLERAAARSKGASGSTVVDAACISMRGIKQHPQLPRGFTFNCIESPFIKFKKNLKLLFDVVGRSSARLLTIPLAIYYAHALPESVVQCPWRLIAPHPVLAKAIALLTAPHREHDEIDEHEIAAVPIATIGVHLRSLEGSCQSRHKQYNPREADGLEKQCTMQAPYVLSVARDAFMKIPSLRASLLDAQGNLRPMKDLVCVIADDGQQPTRAEALAQSLPNAVRTQRVISGASSSAVKQYLDALTKGVPGSTVRAQAPYDLSSHFHLVPVALPLLLDFWALANATVFVGNQVSTLSMNVCRYRRAVGLRCENFV